MINVVGAIITNELGEIFIAQRPKTGLMPNLWEFVGGKQDEGETLEQALVREVQEEANITIKVGNFLIKENFTHKDKDYCLHLYFATIVDDKNFKLNVHQNCKWVKPQELNNFEFPPVDKQAIKILSNPAKGVIN